MTATGQAKPDSRQTAAQRQANSEQRTTAMRDDKPESIVEDESVDESSDLPTPRGVTPRAGLLDRR